MRRFALISVRSPRTPRRKLVLVFVLLAAVVAAGGFSAVPVAAQDAPQADCTPLNCSQVKITPPYVLTFDQNHGGLPDKNGVGTGFTWVDRPTAGGTGYLPANLEVNMTAGLLSITTTPGIAYLGENKQDNTLGVGLDAANQVLVLETRLVNLPPATGNLEQAGLWYGANDDNYLKLVVIYEIDGTKIQFLEERNGVEAQQVVTPVIPLDGPVQLRLRVNPAARTVTAYYSLGGGPLQEFKTLSVPRALFNGPGGVIDPAVGTAVFGGIFASDRFLQGVAVFQFDYFSVTSAGAVTRIYMPLIAKQ